MKRIGLFVLVLVVVCGACQAVEKDVQAMKKAKGESHISGKRWAIVVGINEYEDKRVRDLEYAATVDSDSSGDSIRNSENGIFISSVCAG